MNDKTINLNHEFLARLLPVSIEANVTLATIAFGCKGPGIDDELLIDIVLTLNKFHNHLFEADAFKRGFVCKLVEMENMISIYSTVLLKLDNCSQSEGIESIPELRNTLNDVSDQLIYCEKLLKDLLIIENDDTDEALNLVNIKRSLRGAYESIKRRK